MKRTILAMCCAAALAVPAVAAADPAEPQCSAHGLTWGTPGKMFQSARADLGVNPAELAGVHGVSVGGLVAAGCRA